MRYPLPRALVSRCCLALLVLSPIIIIVVGCSASQSEPPATPSALGSPTREPTATTVPPTASASEPSSSPTARMTPTAAATETPRPTPSPTPVPLPQVCLRQQFADDAQACHAAPSYDIELVVDPANARVTGHQTIEYTNAEAEPLDTMYLRLLPNTPAYGGTMTVTHLLRFGEPITPVVELEGSALRIPLDPPLLPDRMLKLSMDFTVDVPTTGAYGHALFSYIRGVMALPSVYPKIPVHNEEGWNLEIAREHGDDIFADVGIFHVTIEAPPEFTVITTGACAHPEEGIWDCEAAPMRDFALILGENYERAAREVDGVVVNSYFYPWHAGGGGKALEVAVDAVEAFSESFGPYPYTELDVVETPNYLGGMEYSSLVVVEDGLYPGVAGVEWLTAHEVAHQWWTIVVGNDQIDEPWLDEGLTQYSTMLHYEKAYGKQRGDAIVQSVFVQTYESLKRRGRKMPAGLPANAYPPDLYWDIVYDVGALYFHELRERVGDDAFFDILQTYFTRYRYAIATAASFLETVEEITGDPQLDLYEYWILGQS
ncbi:MAG: M1 family metallopeptidase [Anaerolineae bacterium]